ncbi:hypothetical protein KIF24_28455 [Micromonospora sp. Llam7]|uniref:hypothetical protein n=1 Tax=Micromonospora tarapacensis TaxID=2835305 RepID=UPI001C82C6EC|nr:hypothetical protein [Micromonospora tarapacensis]MBX7269553.1 hypothetical protein [Micromonospora tarapacensis]
MVDIAAPLKSHQVEVLRWVEAGCPDADMPGDGAKHTARALQGRRLVTVSRRDGRWSAALTERGRYYLDNGRYPVVTGTAIATARTLPENSSTQPASGGGGRQPTTRPSVIQEATALIERLQTNGGTVVVSDPDTDKRASYRRAIHAAKQHKLVPVGCDLRRTGRNTGDLVIRLYSAAQPYDTDWNRLRLNQGDIRIPPPADYSALEQDPTNLQVAPESIPRVIGLLHTLDHAGADRKCRVGVDRTTKNPKPFLKFGSARRSLDIFEEHDQVPHVLTADERRTRRLRPWADIPEFDKVATGRLRLEVRKSQSGQRLAWRDTATKSLKQQAVRIVADIIKAIKEQEQISAAFRQREKERQAAARLAVCQGNRPARFGKRPTEKDPHHGHLAGGPLHSASGLEKRASGNAGTALQADSTRRCIGCRHARNAGDDAGGGRIPTTCRVPGRASCLAPRPCRSPLAAPVMGSPPYRLPCLGMREPVSARMIDGHLVRTGSGDRAREDKNVGRGAVSPCPGMRSAAAT